MNSPRTPLPSLSSELKDLIVNRNILTTRTRLKVLNALDEINQENILKKQRGLRMQAIQEILSSEVKYLSQLETIMKYFMTPILENKLLSTSSYTTLFENVETLYNVNGELLTEIKRNSENVAHAFYKLAPFFKLYSVYAYNYKRALDLLQNIQQSDRKTSEFIANQESRPEVNSKLSSLLIAPIQRVPRYKLLLKEVIRYTSPKDSDYNTLQASLVEIEKVAKHINTLVAEYEETQELLELQKRITGSINLVKPGRKLIRQGPLMRVSRKGNSSHRRHFVLLSDTLLYCKGDPESSLTICCILPLNKCKVEAVLSNGLFKVVCLKETLLLYSLVKEDTEAWILTLQDAVKKYIECRQTLRKESSSRVPMRNITRFPSENRFEIRRNRKRKCIPEEIKMDVENDSDIIYVNQDNEPDDKQSRFFPLKKFKLHSKDRGSVNDNIRCCTDKLKNKNSHSVQRDTTPLVDKRKPNSGEKQQNREELSGNENRFICNIYSKDPVEHTNTTKKQTDNEEQTLFFHSVGKFFSFVRSSFKGFFQNS